MKYPEAVLVACQAANAVWMAAGVEHGEGHPGIPGPPGAGAGKETWDATEEQLLSTIRILQEVHRRKYGDRK